MKVKDVAGKEIEIEKIEIKETEKEGVFRLNFKRKEGSKG